MIIPFPYEIINRYYKRQMCYVQFKIDNIDFELSLTSLGVKFKIYNFELHITQIYTHDIIISIKLAFDNAIINTDDIHNRIKIIEYNNLLFGCSEYIEIWMSNYIKYVINEPGYYSEIDNLYYIDLMSVFDIFFNQILN